MSMPISAIPFPPFPPFFPRPVDEYSAASPRLARVKVFLFTHTVLDADWERYDLTRRQAMYLLVMRDMLIREETTP
jgi:hypothetical protein